MGMAASQARYLALTARKSNVEYEGQQINQARTALANQSANTFNELLSLEVPTAPSTSDYTTLQYSYTDGTEAETISSMMSLSNDPDGYNYLVTHYHYSDVYTGVQSKKSNPQVTMGTSVTKNTVDKSNVTQDETTGTYSIDGNTLSKYDETDETQKANYDALIEEYNSFAKTDISEVYTYTDSDGNMCFTTQSSLDAAIAGTTDLTDYSVASGVPTYVGNCEVKAYDPSDSALKTAYEQICSEFPNESIATSDNIYTWTYQGRTYFASLEDLAAAAASAPDPAKPTENQSKLTQYYAENISTKIETTEKAFVDLDNSGRPQTIRYEDSTATFSLNTESITDENAYQDAMNQYNYDMQVYEKAIADINAKTEKIQEEDRTLELRLRQLDTEQNALQTELDAVKKVIEKNIESTFKTFES